MIVQIILRSWAGPGRLGPRPASAVQEAEEVGAVAALGELGGAGAEFVVGEEALAPGDLLGGADLEALPVLDGADEVGGVVEVGERPGVQPRGAAGEDLDLQGP